MVDRPKADKKKITVWDQNEVNKFLLAAKEDRLYLCFLLALTCGLRQSEVLGLKWRNVDLENENLYVVETLSHDGKEFYKKTKSKSSNRTVAIPGTTINEIRKQRIRNAEERLSYKGFYEDNNLVIPSKVGTPMSPRNVLRTFDKLIKDANVPKITYHDLRHTHASLLLKQNVHPKVVSERLGHADVRITLERYSHLLPNMQQDVAKNFDKLLFGS